MKIVISHFNEDLSWIRSIPDHWEILVYYKGNMPRWYPRVSYVSLENKHRESGTFLHHVIQNYNSLDDLTLFCQGHPFDHCKEFLDVIQMTDIFGIASAVKQINKSLIRPKVGYVALGATWINNKKSRERYVKSFTDSGRIDWETKLTLAYDKLWQIFFQQNWEKPCRNVWGAQFVATKRALRYIPLKLYKKLFEFHEQEYRAPWAMEHNFPELFLQFQKAYRSYHLMV